MSNNKINIIGWVGDNPKQKVFDDTNNRVTKISVAVKNYGVKSKDDETTWFECDAWNGLGDRIFEYVTKGREIQVEGRLVVSTYDKKVNGETVKWPKVHIKMSDFHLCGKKPESKEENGSAETPL